MNLDAENFYTEKASLYHRVFFDFFRYDKGVKAYFDKAQYGSSGAKVLDAVCGSGLLTQAVQAASNRQGFHDIVYHAFDLTEAMLNLFRKWIAESGAANIELQGGQLPPVSAEFSDTLPIGGVDATC